MANVSFLIRRALRMDWKAMWRTAGMLRKNTETAHKTARRCAPIREYIRERRML